MQKKSAAGGGGSWGVGGGVVIDVSLVDVIFEKQKLQKTVMQSHLGRI